jgi:hypothetical protein
MHALVGKCALLVYVAALLGKRFVVDPVSMYPRATITAVRVETPAQLEDHAMLEPAPAVLATILVEHRVLRALLPALPATVELLPIV